MVLATFITSGLQCDQVAKPKWLLRVWFATGWDGLWGLHPNYLGMDHVKGQPRGVTVLRTELCCVKSYLRPRSR